MTDEEIAAALVAGLRNRTASRKAQVVANEILDRLNVERQSDWPLVASLVAKKLESVAWDYAMSAMFAYDPSAR
jgi:hypothetical protein